MEDTDTTLDEIESTFGVEVRGIVDEVTDDKSLPKAERKRLQVEYQFLPAKLYYIMVNPAGC